jgi:hypothetical protein
MSRVTVHAIHRFFQSHSPLALKEQVMRDWTAWALTGVVLSLAILTATCLIGVARVSPRLGRLMARSGLAVAALRFAWQVAASFFLPRRD